MGKLRAPQQKTGGPKGSKSLTEQLVGRLAPRIEKYGQVILQRPATKIIFVFLHSWTEAEHELIRRA